VNADQQLHDEDDIHFGSSREMRAMDDYEEDEYRIQVVPPSNKKKISATERVQNLFSKYKKDRPNQQQQKKKSSSKSYRLGVHYF
jgi:hypothetical protein